MDPSPADAIAAAASRADGHAPFLRRAMQRDPALLAMILTGDVPAALAAARCEAPDITGVRRALRIERQAVSLVVGLADLAGVAPFEQVVQILSDLADRSLDRAIAAAFAEIFPGEVPRGFAVLALGKHGSRELNYSSDIDPILIFDPATLPRRARDEPVEAAVRLAKRVVDLLQTRDADGYVFRVDLRLRPMPEATPIILSIDAAISYYESSALAWERAAFIRARAAAGDIALGTRFLAAIRPFIWRSALDYGAIDQIRRISHRIRDHHAQGQSFGPGFDLKRGRGGIREVEFFAQVHQLIHGGREPALRAPATLDALAALAAAGRIDGDDARGLASAYRLDRTIEHRLQMIEDQQTHSLPRAADALDNVAQLHGLSDGDALITLLRPHVDAVSRIYGALADDAPGGLSDDPERLEQTLAAADFPDPSAARARIDAWRSGTARAMRSPAARDALEAVLPALVTALGRAADPNAALNRFDDLVTKLPSAINLFRLLEAQPPLARLVLDVLTCAPTLADALGRRPGLLDGLIDASAFDAPGSVADLAAEFGRADAGDDYQMLLDRVRARVGERKFALGVQLIERAADPLDVAAGYARVAEAAIEVLAAAAIGQYAQAHGRVPGSELVVLALGRLGGGALTHASDLDLIYLFTGDHLAESDGAKPLGATHYYNRLAQRVSAALSVATPAGPLYEIDTRLRPSGAQGLLAVSVESFARYQAESAWTWEHMALTRARVVFGSPTARSEVAAIVAGTLRTPRDAATVAADAARMRGEMAKHKPPSGPFDVKLIEGGLVDCEFAVHVAQLIHHRGLDPSLGIAIAELSDAGLIAPAMRAANDLLTRMLVTLRLVSPAGGVPAEADRVRIAAACRVEDWAALETSYARARETIVQEWRRILAASEAGD